MDNYEDRWIGIEEAAKYLDVNKDTIRNWIKKNNDIPAHKIGKLWKFKKSELDAWIKSGKSASQKIWKENEMGTVLLSLKPEAFQNVLSGKKYMSIERFSMMDLLLHIFTSVDLSKRLLELCIQEKKEIIEWKKTYKDDCAALERIDEYLKHHKVEMEIQKFQNTTSVSLGEIKKVFHKFIIPQMYYYLDDHPMLQYLEDNLIPIGEPIIHTFENITSNQICVH